MKGYTVRDVARMLDLSSTQVRAYARAGFLDPSRGSRGEYRFSFQDLVLLRTAKGLVKARVPARRVRDALRRLKQQLPTGRPLSGLHIAAQGDHVVVRQGNTAWNPESGQAEFNFEVAELVRKVAPHGRRIMEAIDEEDEDLDAIGWHGLGLDLEAAAPEQAREAYRRALELDPHNVDSRVNLGRLLHEVGLFEAAEAHYRLALSVRPANATAQFNLGVCLEDLDRRSEAITAYREAVRSDPEGPDAYYNLARLLEKRGDSKAALRYLQIYRNLSKDH